LLIIYFIYSFPIEKYAIIFKFGAVIAHLFSLIAHLFNQSEARMFQI